MSLVGSPPMNITKKSAIVGNRPIRITQQDKIVVINSTDESYALWYYQTPASYMDAFL